MRDKERTGEDKRGDDKHREMRTLSGCWCSAVIIQIFLLCLQPLFLVSDSGLDCNVVVVKWNGWIQQFALDELLLDTSFC